MILEAHIAVELRPRVDVLWPVSGVQHVRYPQIGQQGLLLGRGAATENGGQKLNSLLLHNDVLCEMAAYLSQWDSLKVNSELCYLCVPHMKHQDQSANQNVPRHSTWCHARIIKPCRGGNVLPFAKTSTTSKYALLKVVGRLMSVLQSNGGEKLSGPCGIFGRNCHGTLLASVCCKVFMRHPPSVSMC